MYVCVMPYYFFAAVLGVRVYVGQLKIFFYCFQKRTFVKEEIGLWD